MKSHKRVFAFLHNEQNELGTRQAHDREVVLNAMRQAVEGDYELISEDQIEDQELASLYNELIRKVIRDNNDYTLRLNEAVRTVGNTEIVTEMLELVNNQNTSVAGMRGTSEHLSESISKISTVTGEISSYVNDVVGAFNESVNQINESINKVNKSYEQLQDVNEKVAHFKENTSKINEIIGIVKGIADETNLLSLNASIEAARAGEMGKGFGVVANEVKNLSNTTKKSTEDIAKYISTLQHDSEDLASTIIEVSKQLREGNNQVEKSVQDIRQINANIQTIDQGLKTINKQVSEQNQSTEGFLMQIGELAGESSIIHNHCMEVGELLFKISRGVDGIRSLIARTTAKLSTREWLEIFEVDHMVYTWRLCNHIYGFEKLQLKNIENSNTCKLGKWYNTTEDTSLPSNVHFNEMKKQHELLHKKGVACFKAVEDGNKEQALGYYKEAQEILEKLVIEIGLLKQ